jgi:hypothetical protein
LILVNPLGSVTSDATLSNPETAVVPNSMPGNWTVPVDGFSLPAMTD